MLLAANKLRDTRVCTGHPLKCRLAGSNCEQSAAKSSKQAAKRQVRRFTSGADPLSDGLPYYGATLSPTSAPAAPRAAAAAATSGAAQTVFATRESISTRTGVDAAASSSARR